jgi:WhiB family redox-sensing transcriptional regulator
MLDLSWREKALCRGCNPDIWIPRTTKPTAACYVEAKKICDRCPVEDECLRFAISTESGNSMVRPTGMFGGKTPGWRKVNGPRLRREWGIEPVEFMP